MLKSAVSSSTNNAYLLRHVYSHVVVTCRKSSSTKITSTSSSFADKNLNPELPPPFSRGEMRIWQLSNYGGPSDLQLSTSMKIPTIKSPSDVLIQVKAASINPLDLAMTKGYGSETINVLRTLCSSTSENPFSNLIRSSKKSMIEFPLTVGRDFSGTIVEMGHVAKGKHGLRVGDDVFGVVGVHRQGSQAEFITSSVDTIRRKPRNLNFLEAASIPYVGLTTWSAIRITGTYSNLAQKRFLVLGGSGGVGTFAVQYLKAHDANVTTTCSSDAVSLMMSLFCDSVIDYNLPGAASLIHQNAPYDCILDLSGPANSEKSLALCNHLRPGLGQFITLSPPFLSNIDKHGLIGGAMKNVSDLVSANMKSWNTGNTLAKWAFFIPNGTPLKTFADLIESQRIRPVICQTFKFADIPEAFNSMEVGHLRGKIVIDFT